eukprot:IDg14360t1
MFEYTRTQTELQSFLGLCNVYRRCSPNFVLASIIQNEKLRKGKPNKLQEASEGQQRAFESLKVKLALTGSSRYHDQTYRTLWTQMPAKTKSDTRCCRHASMEHGTSLGFRDAPKKAKRST